MALKTSSIFRVLLVLVLLGFFAVMAVQLFDFLEPYLFPLNMLRGKARYVTERIIVGPYPHVAELYRLKKREGVVEIVTLLNSSNPVESKLLRRERTNAERLGIRIVSKPMSFTNLISESNEEMAERVAAYALRKYGKGAKDGALYINCYLGRHRVKLVEREIKERLAQKEKKKGILGLNERTRKRGDQTGRTPGSL